MPARYAFALALIAIAASTHWLIFPFTESRIPFLLFVPATILATAAAGRGPGLLVVIAGVVNGSLQFTPSGSLRVVNTSDRVALLAFVLTGLFLIFIGYRLRTIARREYEDLHELHELSAALASAADLKDQLALVLQTLVRVHRADRGVVSLYDAASNTMQIAASIGAVGEGERFEFSTPVSSRNGALLGAIAVYFPAARRPTPREISLADICARKAAVAIERAAAEDTARLQEHALREADRRKDEFLAILAHELRNPLAPIRQAGMVAASERANDSQKRWAYTVIERQVQQMSLLLDDLLDVSRITRGALSLRKQQVDVQAVVSAAVETARPHIDSHHHQLVVDVPAALQVHCDPLRLSQVFANLLTNAAKYTPPGGTIRLVAEQQERTLVVRVEDNGMGLRPEDLPRIFQMFSRAGPGHEHAEGGLGIGLALTRGLVEMHSGSIEAQSAGSGKGSVFTVRLPIGDVVPVAAAGRADEREPRLSVARRVLIADDNRDAAETLAVVLRLEGHDVVVAHDGRAALALFEHHRPDVALLDVGMPELDGYEVARRIRARADGAHVLLIAVTGWGQEKDRQQSAAAGFDHHVTKPVAPERLIRLIQPRRKGRVAAR